jgi:ferric-dicitrate binding protein FerR (iron transport regulator)
MSTGNREVYLSGEGFFEVRKSIRSEFVVRVGDIEITALGTTFNVKAYPEEELIEATLVEGLLRISREDDRKGAIILKPNEKLSILKDESGMLSETEVQPSGPEALDAHPRRIPFNKVHVEKRIDPVTEISWKDSKWVIRGKSMEEMSVMLQRRYDVEIILGDDAVGSTSFTGTLLDETLEQVLYAIRSTSPIDYDIDGRKVVLTENKTLKKQYERLLKK